MAPSRLEHFIRFGTDAAGIERMLRMVQAILMVVLSQQSLTSGFTKLVAWGNQHVWIEPRIASIAVLSQLRSNVALARRFFRIFRFLESFKAAHVIYTSLYAPPPPPPAPTPTESNEKDASAVSDNKSPSTAQEAPAHKSCANPNCRNHPGRANSKTRTRAPAEAWLDMFSRTFNGMYLLLETLTLLDALALPGFSLFGSLWFPLLHVEAQRFWLFALVCGVVGGLVKLFKLVASGPAVPDASHYAWPGSSAVGAAAAAEMAEWERQRERMRRMVWARREGRRVWIREIRTTGWRIARRCVADILDLTVPGVVVGWVRVEPGTVGLCMVVSTWFTGLEVWERCRG
ncbi:unnamed protein product [Discula destructiva]